MMDVEYNGILASSLGIYAKNIPDIPAAVRKEKTVDIPGMDGTLILLEGGYESTEIKVDFNFIGDSDRWDERFGLAKKWLSKRGGLLRFGCDPEHYYKILKVEVDDGKRTTERVGNFTATFLTKDGLRYLESGLGEMPASDVVDNPYEIAYPIYKITGEGECTLVVNDGKMVANIGQVLYGKNIVKDGFSETIDMTEVATRIIPKSYNGYMIAGDAPWIDSPLIEKYPTVHYKVMSFEDVKMRADASEDDETNGTIICDTQEQIEGALKKKCEEQYAAGVDKPKITIKADMELLQNTELYEDVKELRRISHL